MICDFKLKKITLHNTLNTKKTTFICCLFLFISIVYSTKGIAQKFDFDTKRVTLYKDLLKLKTNHALPIIDSLIEADENGVDIYLRNQIDIIHLLSNDSPLLFKQLKNNKDHYLKLIAPYPDDSPYKKFIEAEIHLSWAFVKLNFSQETSAFFDFKQAYKLINKNDDEFHSFLPNKKTLGMIHLIIGNIPSEYRWLTNTLGFEGNVSQGTSNLEDVANSGSIFKTECRLLMGVVDAFLFRNDLSGINAIEKLQEEEKDNLLFNFILASLYAKSKWNDKVIETMLNRPNGVKYATVPAYSFFIAEAYLNKLMYTEAIEYYLKFLSQYEGNNHVQATYYKLYVAYFLNGDENMATKYLRKIDIKSDAVTYPDRYAVAFVKANEFSAPKLMKARLLTDGGYYEQALSILFSEEKLKTKKDRVEYEYRLARIYHLLGIPSKAITFYKNTIEQSSTKNPWYFAANACLQLGYIYKEKYPSQASFYFKQVKNYHNHIYKNSLTDKANRELKEVEVRLKHERQ